MAAEKARVVWLAAAVAVCAAPAAGRGGPPTAEDVLKVWQACEEKVKTACFTWDKREVIPKDYLRRELGLSRSGDNPIPPSDLVLNGKCRASMGYGVMRYEYDGVGWSIMHGDVRPASTLSSFNGKVYKRIHVKSLADDHPEAVVRPAGKNTSTEFDELAVRPLWLAVRGAQSVAQMFPLLLHEPTGRKVVINGRSCVEFVMDNRRSGTRSQMYFDTERDYQLVRKIESAKGMVIVKLDVTYAPHPEVGWLPDKWEYVTKDRQGRTGVSVACKLTSAEINPHLPEGEFDAQLPPRAWVSDFTGDKEVQYVVQADGTTGVPVLLDRAYTYEQLAETSRKRFPWRQVLYIVSATGVCVSLAVLAWRRIRHRSRRGSMTPNDNQTEG